MKKLEPYEEDPLSSFDAIVTAKRKPRKAILLRLRSMILRRYEQYAKAKVDLAVMKPCEELQQAEIEALIHCYEGNTTAFSELKEKIRKAQPIGIRWGCQYCGEESSSTWDHYLPKAIFPEFAVYAPNLLPSCSECNTNRKKWLEDGERTTVNLYYDAIEEKDAILLAVVTIKEGYPTTLFDVTDGPASKTPFGRLYARHCSALKLYLRFQRRSYKEIEIIWSDIHRLAKRMTPTNEVIMEVMTSKADDMEAQLGANHWKAALHRAAARSRAFIEYCIQNPPSEPGHRGGVSPEGAKET